MSRREYIQCDGTGCEKTCVDPLPDDWPELRLGGDHCDKLHFCSQDCLWNYIIDNWQIGNEHTGKTVTTYELDSMMLMCKPLSDGRFQSLVTGDIYRLDKPEEKECKARRFLFFDDAANSYEGLMWGNGKVTVEGKSMADPNAVFCTYGSWEDFRSYYMNGGGVQWIDKPEPRTGSVIDPLVAEDGLPIHRGLIGESESRW